jgi:hypothetical protein
MGDPRGSLAFRRRQLAVLDPTFVRSLGYDPVQKALARRRIGEDVLGRLVEGSKPKATSDLRPQIGEISDRGMHGSGTAHDPDDCSGFHLGFLASDQVVPNLGIIWSKRKGLQTKSARCASSRGLVAPGEREAERGRDQAFHRSVDCAHRALRRERSHGRSRPARMA